MNILKFLVKKYLLLFLCFYFYINLEIFIGMVVFNFCLNHNLLFTFFSILSD